MTKIWFEIPDGRLNSTAGYPPEAKHDRRGQMKRSWKLGVAQRTDGSESVKFEEGLTWGSIGQLLGYLLGEVDEDHKDKLYAEMERAYRGTDHWVSGGNEREG